jgi:NCAIR mutase (PurE)-related protein
LLKCPYENEHIAAHNTLQDTIATIVLESGTHVQKEVSHLFFHHTQQRVDILITRKKFQTLMDVIIVDSTCTNMVQQISKMITHATMTVAYEKT